MDIYCASSDATSKADCSTMKCTCKKHNIDCKPACGNCRGSGCLNTQHDSYEEVVVAYVFTKYLLNVPNTRFLCWFRTEIILYQPVFFAGQNISLAKFSLGLIFVTEPRHSAFYNADKKIHFEI